MLIAPSPLLGEQIGDAGVKHIANALMSNSSLTQLHLICALFFEPSFSFSF